MHCKGAVPDSYSLRHSYEIVFRFRCKVLGFLREEGVKPKMILCFYSISVNLYIDVYFGCYEMYLCEIIEEKVNRSNENIKETMN